MRAAIPIMRQQGRGRIINTISRVAEGGQPRSSAYGAAKAGISQGDPAAQTFWQEWKQLKHDFDSYMGEVSDSNRAELQALMDEKEQFDTRLAQLPAIKIPHYPKPKVPEEKAVQPQPAQPSEFVARGAHRPDGSIEPTRRYPEVP